MPIDGVVAVSLSKKFTHIAPAYPWVVVSSVNWGSSPPSQIINGFTESIVAYSNAQVTGMYAIHDT